MGQGKCYNITKITGCTCKVVSFLGRKWLNGAGSESIVAEETVINMSVFWGAYHSKSAHFTIVLVEVLVLYLTILGLAIGSIAQALINALAKPNSPPNTPPQITNHPRCSWIIFSTISLTLGGVSSSKRLSIIAPIFS